MSPLLPRTWGKDLKAGSVTSALWYHSNSISHNEKWPIHELWLSGDGVSSTGH